MSKGAYIEYDSNNSGGGWWITDQNWKDLEAAGWEVQWFKNEASNGYKERFCDALAMKARRYGVSRRVAMAEFEDITGLSPYEEGCDCCGQPHYFSQYDQNGKWMP